MKNLSENATKILNAAKVKPLHDQDAKRVLYPEPDFKADRAAYWQWDANNIGFKVTRCMGGELFQEFAPIVKHNDATNNAVSELIRAGLISAQNNGYNTFTYFAI